MTAEHPAGGCSSYFFLQSSSLAALLGPLECSLCSSSHENLARSPQRGRVSLHGQGQVNDLLTRKGLPSSTGPELVERVMQELRVDGPVRAGAWA